MSKKTIFFIAVITPLLFMMSCESTQPEDKKKEGRVYELNETTHFFKEVMPDFSYYIYEKNHDCYELFNKSSEHQVNILFSSPACDNIDGFGGPIHFAIVLDRESTIKSLYLLKNNETPRVFQRLHDAKFFEQWNGLSFYDVEAKTVDTVSGATFSCNAVIESVKRRMKLFARTFDK